MIIINSNWVTKTWRMMTVTTRKQAPRAQVNCPWWQVWRVNEWYPVVARDWVGNECHVCIMISHITIENMFRLVLRWQLQLWHWDGEPELFREEGEQEEQQCLIFFVSWWSEALCHWFMIDTVTSAPDIKLRGFNSWSYWLLVHSRINWGKKWGDKTEEEKGTRETDGGHHLLGGWEVIVEYFNIKDLQHMINQPPVFIFTLRHTYAASKNVLNKEIILLVLVSVYHNFDWFSNLGLPMHIINWYDTKYDLEKSMC
jgi:hypothetical protein